MPSKLLRKLKKKDGKRDFNDSNIPYSDTNAGPHTNEDGYIVHYLGVQSPADVSVRDGIPRRKPVPERQKSQQDHNQTVIPLVSDSQQMGNRLSQGRNSQSRQDTHPTQDGADYVEENLRPGLRLRYQNQHQDSSARPGDDLWSWIPHIPQPADDKTVISRVTEILTMADQFVKNFYCDRFDFNPQPNRQINDTDFKPPLMSTEMLMRELVGSENQMPLIRHWLITRLLSLISFDLDAPEKSLLPVEFRNYTVLAASRTRSEPTEDEMSRPYLQPALSAYRVLSAYIRPDLQKDTDYRHAREELINEVIASFDASFGYWANQKPSSQRYAVLAELLEKTGDLGVFLFEQPSVFFFDWTVSEQELTNNAVPTWPRMGKVFDDRGQYKDPVDTLIHMRCERVVLRPVHEIRQMMPPTKIDPVSPHPTIPSSSSSSQAARNVRSSYQQVTESRPLELEDRVSTQHASMFSPHTRCNTENQETRFVELPASSHIAIRGPGSQVQEMDSRAQPYEMEATGDDRQKTHENFQQRVRNQHSTNKHDPDLRRLPSLTHRARLPSYENREGFQTRASSSSPPKKAVRSSRKSAPERSPPSSFPTGPFDVYLDRTEVERGRNGMADSGGHRSASQRRSQRSSSRASSKSVKNLVFGIYNKLDGRE